MLWSAYDKTRSCDGVEGNRPTVLLEGETYIKENMARISQDRRKQTGVSFKAYLFKGWAITLEVSLTDQSVHYRLYYSLLPLADKAHHPGAA